MQDCNGINTISVKFRSVLFSRFPGKLALHTGALLNCDGLLFTGLLKIFLPWLLLDFVGRLKGILYNLMIAEIIEL